MPCSDSSSSFNLIINDQDELLSFEYAKITCGQNIGGGTGLKSSLKGKCLEDILKIDYNALQSDLKIEDEEKGFLLFLEFKALISVIAHFLGIEDQSYDPDRCHISSIEQNDEGNTEVALVILPPRELPDIIACGIKHRMEVEED